MIRSALFFLAGAAVVAGAVVATGGTAAGAFWLGAALATLVYAAALAVAVRRIGFARSVEGLLWLSSKRPVAVAHAARPRLEVLLSADSVGGEVVAGLVNLGTRRADARAAAAQALAELPDAEFGRVFQAAVNIARKMSA